MLYPLKFYPILKEKIWGGNKLQKLLNKPTTKNHIGESWEISTVGDEVSVVANGKLEGKKLDQLIETYTSNLLGEKIYEEFGNQFPLLIKFIDAKEDLSIQLHPDDTLAKKRHNSFGKTEMWHVVQADNDAKLIIGFNKKTTKEEYQKYLEKNKITELLNFEHIGKGDNYFIKSGTIHAIGAGSLIAEIQQTSDITYRVYDWGRKDNHGNYRELHTDLALDAIQFEVNNSFKLPSENIVNKVSSVISSNYFTTNTILLEKNTSLEREYKTLDSFVVLMCVAGEGKIITDNHSLSVVLGETILIPAAIKNVSIVSNNKTIKLLEVYI